MITMFRRIILTILCFVFYRERSERERRERDLSEAAPEPLSPSRRFEGRDNEGKDVLNYQYRRRREHGPFVQLKPQHCNRRGIQENHRKLLKT